MTNTQWSYEYSAYTTSDGKEIPAFEIFDSEGVKIADTNEDESADKQEMHARLIAAAPELLEALEAIYSTYGDKQVVWNKTRTAITKARGQS